MAKPKGAKNMVTRQREMAVEQMIIEGYRRDQISKILSEEWDLGRPRVNKIVKDVEEGLLEQRREGIELLTAKSERRLYGIMRKHRDKPHVVLKANEQLMRIQGTEAPKKSEHTIKFDLSVELLGAYEMIRRLVEKDDQAKELINNRMREINAGDIIDLTPKQDTKHED